MDVKEPSSKLIFSCKVFSPSDATENSLWLRVHTHVENLELFSVFV